MLDRAIGRMVYPAMRARLRVDRNLGAAFSAQLIPPEPGICRHDHPLTGRARSRRAPRRVRRSASRAACRDSPSDFLTNALLPTAPPTMAPTTLHGGTTASAGRAESNQYRDEGRAERSIFAPPANNQMCIDSKVFWNHCIVIALGGQYRGPQARARPSRRRDRDGHGRHRAAQRPGDAGAAEGPDDAVPGGWRSQAHKYRNVLGHLPERLHAKRAIEQLVSALDALAPNQVHPSAPAPVAAPPRLGGFRLAG